VTLQIYDLSGKFLSSLIAKTLIPGDYRLPFSAKNLVAGMYLLKLTVDNKNYTQKLLYLN